MTTEQAPSQPLPQPSSPSPLRLTRLKIHHLRNVQPNTELFFNDRYNVLLGVNASGKTTLLNLISACIRGDFSAYKREVFHVDFNMTVGADTFSFEVSNQINISELDINTGFVFSSAVSCDGASSGRRVHGLVDESYGMLMANLLVSYRKDPIYPRLYAAYRALMSNTQAIRHDESLGFYEKITRHEDPDEILDRPLASVWIESKDFKEPPPQDPNSPRSRANFFPDGLIDAFDNARLKDRAAQDVLFDDTVIFQDFLSLSGFQKVSIRADKILSIASLESSQGILEGDPRPPIIAAVRKWGRFAFRFHDGEDAKPYDLLSYGQKRLFSFFYYLACNPDVVIVDELVNGMHHKWIRECVHLIENRQSFLTSQSPLLLDELHFKTQEEVQRTFIRCRQVEGAGGEVMLVWENMGERASEDFFKAYDVGIQFVSEILKAQRLW